MGPTSGRRGWKWGFSFCLEFRQDQERSFRALLKGDEQLFGLNVEERRFSAASNPPKNPGL